MRRDNTTSQYIYQGNLGGKSYVASPGLIEAVNTAIFLHRPLLLEGEAGCGKTGLAYAVARELGLNHYRWDITSTSEIKQALYTVDFEQRRYDPEARAKDLLNYVQFGALGRAMRAETKPAVVLIDEIDKGYPGFANDLLWLIDEPWEFDIGEIDMKITAEQIPIIFITSNQAKDILSDAFLSKCLYFFIEFPSAESLFSVAHAHYDIASDPALDELVNVAIDRFLTLRQQETLRTKPGVAEFLDWCKLLITYGPEPYPAARLAEDEELPHPIAIFKSLPDSYQLNPAAERELAINIHELMVPLFNLEELHQLCFKMTIPYDELRGEVLSAKTRALILYCQRRGRLPHLIEILNQLRPDEPWPD